MNVLRKELTGWVIEYKTPKMSSCFSSSVDFKYYDRDFYHEPSILDIQNNTFYHIFGIALFYKNAEITQIQKQNFFEQNIQQTQGRDSIYQLGLSLYEIFIIVGAILSTILFTIKFLRIDSNPNDFLIFITIQSVLFLVVYLNVKIFLVTFSFVMVIEELMFIFTLNGWGKNKNEEFKKPHPISMIAVGLIMFFAIFVVILFTIEQISLYRNFEIRISDREIRNWLFLGSSTVLWIIAFLSLLISRKK